MLSFLIFLTANADRRVLAAFYQGDYGTGQDLPRDLSVTEPAAEDTCELPEQDVRSVQERVRAEPLTHVHLMTFESPHRLLDQGLGWI